MTQGGFNRIAFLYDGLASVVFGKALRSAQHLFLDRVATASRVLVIGGGTGEILPHLLQLNSAATIYYIDSASKMIARARKRTSDPRMVFITGTELSIPRGLSFDAVITFFYLDLFEDHTLSEKTKLIANRTTPDSVWLVADFTEGKRWWQGPFLKFMYLFFGLSTGLKTRRLPNWRKQLENAGFTCRESHLFFNEFVESSVYDRLT